MGIHMYIEVREVVIVVIYFENNPKIIFYQKAWYHRPTEEVQAVFQLRVKFIL